ncbi:MYB-like protein [Purpureocillium lavendulum]|uniref:MYB-like protein n=1 Tax=Purpureocillium lavendulum TaxID=1247861 RepID=A0AB34G3B1_9HYPO|nr:MYB-like protein [Purpureocillium lavendulum]
MLLPSALSCDSAQSPHARLQSALLASPPASPPTVSSPASSQSALGNIMTTCRSLQSLLAPPPPLSAPAPSLAQLPTPPLAHAPPPMKLRLRARPALTRTGDDPNTNTNTIVARRRVVKRSAPPRGVNKRRRDDDDDMGRDDFSSSDDDNDGASASDADQPAPPSTPKRARIAPQYMPLGLERSDYHDVHLLNVGADGATAAAAPAPSDAMAPGTELEREADGEEWSVEDDRVLVELVLEKLKLSKTEWQDCARSLGRDRNALGRRWKSLMMKGEVGLKTTRGSRRAKLHGTWR